MSQGHHHISVFQKLEGRMASDFDLKLSDTLRYYTNDTRAAMDLLYRRSRSLANFEQSNRVRKLQSLTYSPKLKFVIDFEF